MNILHINLKTLLGVATVLIGVTACDLDEVNPSLATADAVWSTPEGFVTLVNAAYSDQRQWYGKTDGLFMSEAGTDLWINKELDGYAKELSKYENFAPSTGNPNRKAWEILWKSINLTNAGINRIDEAGFTDPVKKAARLGELRFLRAFYYWHLVETFGGVMLRTEETDEVLLTAERSPVEAFYDLMIEDLQYAVENLPLDQGAEYSRASKKSAMGLLARVYLTRASYGDETEYYTKARDMAVEIIENQGELGVELYDSFEELWDPANNKQNKEALYVVSNSAENPGLNIDPNANRTHMWFMTAYEQHPGLEISVEYGRSDKRRFMPTLALLDFFDETIDARYDASFREVWISNSTEPFVWDEAAVARYGKDPSLIGTTIVPGEDTALLITKHSIPNEEFLPYVVIDRDHVYDTGADNGVIDGVDYVQLIKFEDPTRADAAQEPGYLDIFVIRLAEIYLIAAEAEFQLGNTAKAAEYINVIRTRAAIKTPVDRTEEMQVDAGDITLDFILDERARELAGEHLRWFDLKRTGRLLDRVHAYNPDITEIKPYHVLRPVPQVEMDALLNRDEFGQNPGYE